MNIILGLFLALIVFLLANGLYKLLDRPRITLIDPKARNAAALVVIDMQEDFTRTMGKLAHDPDRLEVAINRINILAKEAHDAGIPVIEVSHSFSAPHEKFAMKLFAGGAGVEGSKGLKRDEALTFHANAHVWKHAGDAFTAPMFERFVEEHRIGHLYLTGQDATVCVNATAQGALKRNFKVTLLDAAILARNPSRWAKLRARLLRKGATGSDRLSVDQSLADTASPVLEG